MNDVLLQKIESLPDRSGVYIMRSADGEVIYVGKAKVLKNRVKQYFSASKKQEKVQAMVDNIADFDYIITLSEKDALALENNLIKKYKPRYNILLKDDKSSPYIKIDMREKFPAIEITRKVRRDGAKYFGPYFNGIYVNTVSDILRSAFRLRNCGRKMPKTKRECLNYHIRLCSGPCCGNISEQEYRESLDRAVAFLSGHDEGVKELVTAKMADAAEREEFERAIEFRTQLDMLDKLKERTLADLGMDKNIDAFCYVTNGVESAVSVNLVRGGKTMGVKNYIVTDAESAQEDALTAFIIQYYESAYNDLPPLILVPVEFDFQPLTDFLYSKYMKRTEIAAPKKGVKQKLVKTACANAEDYLSKSADKEKRKNDMTVGASERLSEILNLPRRARRIECYDISNISGTDKVASMVVFINGDASKSDYRKFKIKTVEGSDDFASMAEVITRRFRRAAEGDAGFSELPDLIIVDGGKGQLSSAHRAMREAGGDVPMVGLAEREEEIFTLGNSAPIILSKNSYALKLMIRIRDEAHRFAITYHRKLRQKRQTSELDNIKGIGAVKRRAILKAFPSVSDLKSASAQDIARLADIDLRAANAVYTYFHPEDGEEI